MSLSVTSYVSDKYESYVDVRQKVYIENDFFLGFFQARPTWKNGKKEKKKKQDSGISITKVTSQLHNVAGYIYTEEISVVLYHAVMSFFIRATYRNVIDH